MENKNMKLKIKAITEIKTEYSASGDMTFILKEITSADGEPISTEVVGFYYGAPNAFDTRNYIGHLKAEYLCEE